MDDLSERNKSFKKEICLNKDKVKAYGLYSDIGNLKVENSQLKEIYKCELLKDSKTNKLSNCLSSPNSPAQSYRENVTRITSFRQYGDKNS